MIEETKILIKEVSGEYAPEISDLIVKTLLETNSKDYPQNIILKVVSNFSPDKLKLLMKQRQTFVAILNDEVIGTAAIEENFIRTVFILPNNQKYGVGKLLVQHIEQIAFKKGYSSLKVSSSITAEGFYVRLGYVALKDVYYGEERNILMEKMLK